MNYPPTDLGDRILKLLESGDRNQAEFYDQVFPSYQVLCGALKTLTESKQVEHYFTEGQPPVLMYRLKRSPNSIFPWNRPKEEAATLRQE